MSTTPDEPQNADPRPLEEAGAAIDEARAAAGQVVRDESIEPVDFPGEEARPAAPPVEED
jgi:hypothetical protein